MFVQFTVDELILHKIISKNDPDMLIKAKVSLFLNRTIKHEQFLDLPVYVIRDFNDDISRIEINIPLYLIKEII